MRRLESALLALMSAGAFASILQAQDLEEGIWTGTIVRGTRAPQEVTFEVRRIPDPHLRWRAGSGEIVSVTLSGLFDNGIPVSSALLDGETLSFSIPRFDDSACSLTRQEDGSFAGRCEFPREMTLVPPSVQQSAAVEVPLAVLNEYVGTYVGQGPGGAERELLVTLENTQLTVRMGPNDTLSFYAESETVFTAASGREVEFVRGDDGDVSEVLVRGGNAGNLTFRRR